MRVTSLYKYRVNEHICLILNFIIKMSKTFIKTLVLTILTYVAVIGTALSVSSCAHKSGHKKVLDADSVETIVQQPVAQWSSAKDFLDWISEDADKQYCDSILFKVMSPEELYNVATVVATRNGTFTKKDIVREYLDRRDVYTALHGKNIGNDTINTNTKDTIIDGVKVQLISTTRYE